jgi:hypothetical protein
MVLFEESLDLLADVAVIRICLIQIDHIFC